LVLADPDLLDTLPEVELRSGLAEVVKHGILADEGLFQICAQGWGTLQADASRPGGWGELVRRGMAVKLRYILADPYERGQRAALNLGHTVGHALERAAGYRLRHGEAVAIGLAAEARLSERVGLAQPGLADEIAAALAGLGLPTCYPDEIDPRALLAALTVDKKKHAGKVHFALPVRIGEVQTGVALEMDEAALMEIGR
jgi:3-dehydroquinate synthetase